MGRFNPVGLAAGLVIGIIVSFVVLFYGTVSPSTIIQVLSLLISMGILFFCSHPLSHYLVANIFGVRTRYFFLKRSDFSKLGGITGKLGSLLPTIGTKLDLMRVAALSSWKREFLFGSGVIVSSTVIVIPLVIALIHRFSLIAMILGFAFLLLNLGFELMFSTKVGDLSKMKRERLR